MTSCSLKRNWEGTDAWNMIHNNDSCALTIERKKIPARILHLTLPNLCIEQWAFIKSQYGHLNELGLIEIVSSLSNDFIGEISLNPADTIKNKKHRLEPVRN